MPLEHISTHREVRVRTISIMDPGEEIKACHLMLQRYCSSGSVSPVAYLVNYTLTTTLPYLAAPTAHVRRLHMRACRPKSGS